MLSSACPTPEPAPVPATTPSAVMPTAAQPCSASAATKVNASETSERRMLPPPPDCVMRSPPELMDGGLVREQGTGHRGKRRYSRHCDGAAAPSVTTATPVRVI